ncbi:DUF6301 family protein [Nocardia vulneris]|uniref:DUF6301 family protein n=1 Tax=Nocardia vulneris TaxID=1141657 RepID=UPI003BB06242
MDQVTLHLTDLAGPSSRRLLADAFADVAASLDGILGAPIIRVLGPYSKIFWNTPKFIGELLLLALGRNASVCRRDSWGAVDELRARGIEL